MPDIAMCAASNCSESKTCRRHADSGTKPSEYQYYSDFKPLVAAGCINYWPVPWFDWGVYRSLELSGCVLEDGQITANVPHDKARFFTVYGRDKDNLAQAIIDAPTLEAGQHALEWLASLSGLSILETAPKESACS